MLCLKLCINSFFKCHIVGFFEKCHIIGQTCLEQNIFHNLWESTDAQFVKIGNFAWIVKENAHFRWFVGFRRYFSFSKE